jgi:hypothetical protein
MIYHRIKPNNTSRYISIMILGLNRHIIDIIQRGSDEDAFSRYMECLCLYEWACSTNRICKPEH